MSQRRLLWHLYPSFLVISIAVLLAVAWYASHFFQIFYHNQISIELEAKAHLIEYQVLPIIKTGNFSELDGLCKKLGSTGLTRITIILPSGEVIGDSDEPSAAMKNHSDRPEFQDALNNGTGSSLRFSNTLQKRMMYLAVAIKQGDKVLAVVRTSVPVTAIDEALKNIYRKLFWAGMAVAVCAAAASFAISKGISRPVERMTRIAKRFASGELDLRLSTPKASELAELARALNEMARQLSNRIDTITKERNETQAILSSMIEGVLAIDSSGQIVSINKAAADFLDVDSIKTRGRSVEEVVRNPQFQQFVQNTLANKQSTETDIFVPNNGGRFLQLHGTSLTDDKGSQSGAVIVLYDITQTRRLEDVRRDFVANVSHELKTPVTSIKGFVETLLDGAVNDPQQAQRFLQIIAKHTDRLNAIIEDLLSLSRLEEDSDKRRLSFEKTYLKPTLVSAIELSKVKAEKKHIAVELTCNEEITAKINSVLIEQAVLNLVDNAVKYSQNDSIIAINVQNLNNEVLIAVSDHGCGIEKQHLPRIFERFYVVDKSRSRQLGGTGLGLSIVKHIAQVHGGYVTVESTPGQGSSFTIHLPFNETSLG
jgi:two-component system, OmpR family, phosphate regulon sensor histidine kinase PhoR